MSLDLTSAAGETPWPQLTLSEWQETRDHLHLWTQVIGKVRMANEAPLDWMYCYSDMPSSKCCDVPRSRR